MRIDVSTDLGYQVASALRGPDHIGQNEMSGLVRPLKSAFTAPLRYFTGVRAGSGPEIGLDFWESHDAEEIHRRLSRVEITDYADSTWFHYLIHSKEAFCGLRKLSGDLDPNYGTFKAFEALLGNMMGGRYGDKPTALIESVQAVKDSLVGAEPCP